MGRLAVFIRSKERAISKLKKSISKEEKIDDWLCNYNTPAWIFRLVEIPVDRKYAKIKRLKEQVKVARDRQIKIEDLLKREYFTLAPF